MNSGIQKVLLQRLKENILFPHTEHSEYRVDDRSKHRKEVIEELAYHTPGQSYGEYFLQQLEDLHCDGFVRVGDLFPYYEISNIYWAMSELTKGQIPPKYFRNKKSKLHQNNILHIHHNQTFHIEENLIRYFASQYPTDEAVNRGIQEIIRKYPDQDPVSTFTVSVVNEAMTWPKKTGEWIVFQMTGNSYHFLALAFHHFTGENDSDLFKLIEKDLKKV